MSEYFNNQPIVDFCFKKVYNILFYEHERNKTNNPRCTVC